MHVDPTNSLWEGILQRASALRRRYANLADVPQDTWSLVNRVALDKFQGRMTTEGNDRDHCFGLWTKAMVCVLNDIGRKERRRADRTPGRRVPLSDSVVLDADSEDLDGHTLEELEAVLSTLVERDEQMGERKSLLVALRYFEGLSWPQLASALGSSVRRVRDEWSVTRAWMRLELKRRGVDPDA